jgi:hypothetical protein
MTSEGSYRNKVEVLKQKSATELLAMIEEESELQGIIEREETMLADSICSRRTKEARSLVKSFNYTKSTSVVESLRHWLSYKGLWLIEENWPTDFVYHWANKEDLKDHEALLRLYLKRLVELHIHTFHPDLLREVEYRPIMPHEERLRQWKFPASLRVLNDGSKDDDINRVKNGELGSPRPIKLGYVSREEFYKEFGQATLTDLAMHRKLYLGGLENQNVVLQKLGLGPLLRPDNPNDKCPRIAYVVDQEDF